MYQNDSISFEKAQSNLEGIEKRLSDIANHLHALEQKDKFLNWVSYDTLFTIVTTFLILFIGYHIQEYSKKRDKKRTVKNELIQFLQLAKDISSNLTNGTKNLYKALYAEATIDTGLTITPPKVLSKSFERLAQIDFKLLNLAIADKKLLTETQSDLDFIERMINTAETYYLSYRVEDVPIRVEIQKDITSYVQELVRFMYEVGNESHIISGIPELRSLIDSSLQLYHNEVTGGGHLRLFYKKILRPIQMTIIDFKLYEVSVICEEIISKGQRLSHDYNEFKTRTLWFKIQYREFHQQLDITQLRLNNNITKIVAIK